MVLRALRSGVNMKSYGIKKRLMNKILNPLEERISLPKFYNMLASRSANDPDFFFVQIGGCNGISDDPIHEYIKKYHWSGIIVEPVKYLFEQLVENYKSEKKLIFENMALSDKNGFSDFYYLKQSNDLPSWYDQIGSFMLSHVLKYKKYIPDIEDRILVEKVPTITLAGIIDKYSVKKLDLLLIDTEGFDYEILKQIKSINIKPKMIFFENMHLSDNDFKMSKMFLRINGYSIIRLGDNTLAFI